MSDLRVVKRTYAGRPGFTWMLLAMAGIGGAQQKGPWRYTYSDGYEFLPYARGNMTQDWDYIAQGCTDVTGAKFQPYVDAAGLGKSTSRHTFKPGHYINGDELDSRRSDYTRLALIRDYKGGLNSDPNTWPEPFKTAYLESH